MPILLQSNHKSVGGIMVSIAAFQAVDPGSIPGRRNFSAIFFIQNCKSTNMPRNPSKNQVEANSCLKLIW